MKLLALIVAAFAAVALVIGLTTQSTDFLLLFGFGVVCAIATFFSAPISAFLKIFVAIFSAEYVLFGLLVVGNHVGFIPQLPGGLSMPVSGPLTVAMFSIAIFAIAGIPIVKRTTVIADRYFEARETSRARVWPFPSYVANERTIAIAMLVFLVVINQVQVVLNVLLSYFSRDFVNALNSKDAHAFWYQLLVVFPLLAFPYIASQVVEFVVQSTLTIRWREWLTNFYARRWLSNHSHYRMSLAGQLADNPDQRISEDIIRFINGYGTPNGVGVYTISIQLIFKFSNLVSFAILLWTLSEGFTLPGTSFAIPGFLLWCAVVYASIGTIAAHVLGKRLRPLSFTRQRFEADFRFSLARLREYGEQIALLKGETTERTTLTRRFSLIVSNYFEIVDVRKILMGFTGFYGQLNPFIPYIVGAPFYFLGRISFGVLSQIAHAFGNVSDALTFFIDSYVQLAEYQSVVDRLNSYETALNQADEHAAALQPPATPISDKLALRDVTVRLPDGRALFGDLNLSFARKHNVLISGQSGSGKSTLFRTIGGIWPYTDGVVSIPQGQSLMVLPQKPYFPIGTLRAAASYPSEPAAFDNDAIVDALHAVQLDTLVDKLDVEDIWSQTLSGGEQQRLAIARAMLARPDWLLLDEATSAMDIELESAIYRTLAERLPETTIVTIAHRPSLMDHHDSELPIDTLGANKKAALAPV